MFQNELKKRETTFDRILEWKNLADEQTNEIRKFIFRWISFNGLYSALYAMEHYSQEKADNASDKKKIEYFCTKFILTNNTLASKIYTEARKKFFIENINERSNGIGIFLKNLEDEKSIEGNAMNMIMIAYKIRCRLFHGEKNPRLNVNHRVISEADKVIGPILNTILEKK